MENLDLNNIGNLDESFSNANGKLKNWFKDKKNIRNTLLMGPAGALLVSMNRKKKAELALLKANASDRADKIKELEDANIALEDANTKLNDTKSKMIEGNSDSDSKGMSPFLKWSLIGGGILLLVGGIITTIVLIKKK